MSENNIVENGTNENQTSESNSMSTFSMSSLLAAVLALIVGFAWITAASKTVDHIMPARHHSDIAKVALIYALVVTIFEIIVVFILNQTNKMYHTYTGDVFFNFDNFVWSNKSPVLNFWSHKNANANADKDANANANADKYANKR